MFFSNLPFLGNFYNVGMLSYSKNLILRKVISLGHHLEVIWKEGQGVQGTREQRAENKGQGA